MWQVEEEAITTGRQFVSASVCGRAGVSQNYLGNKTAYIIIMVCTSSQQQQQYLEMVFMTSTDVVDRLLCNYYAKKRFTGHCCFPHNICDKGLNDGKKANEIRKKQAHYVLLKSQRKSRRKCKRPSKPAGNCQHCHIIKEYDIFHFGAIVCCDTFLSLAYIQWYISHAGQLFMLLKDWKDWQVLK